MGLCSSKPPPTHRSSSFDEGEGRVRIMRQGSSYGFLRASDASSNADFDIPQIGLDVHRRKTVSGPNRADTVGGHRSAREHSTPQKQNVFAMFGVARPTPTKEATVRERRKTTALFASLKCPTSQEILATQVRYGKCSLRGAREENQDRYKVWRHASASGRTVTSFGVFDGHKGSQTSSFLQKKFSEEILKDKYRSRFFSSNIKSTQEAVRDACRRIDSLILQNAKHDSEDESGSTAVWLMLLGDTCRRFHALVGWVGDSVCFLSRNGVGELLTAPHKASDLVPAELERVERAHGFIRGGRVLGILGVSRAFGHQDLKDPKENRIFFDVIICDPEFVSFEVTPDCEFAVLCSDGVTDAINFRTAQSVVDYVKNKLIENGGNIQEAADAMVEEASATSNDNITILIVAFHQMVGLSSSASASRSNVLEEKQVVKNGHRKQHDTSAQSMRVDVTSKDIDTTRRRSGSKTTKAKTSKEKNGFPVEMPKYKRQISAPAVVFADHVRFQNDPDHIQRPDSLLALPDAVYESGDAATKKNVKADEKEKGEGDGSMRRVEENDKEVEGENENVRSRSRGISIARIKSAR
eukprot:g5224.t1